MTEKPEGNRLVLQNNNFQKDLEQLISEVNGISTDFSQYISFLKERQYLINRVVGDTLGSNN